MTFRLTPIGRDGLPVTFQNPPSQDLPSEVLDTCRAMTEFYDRIGFDPPWIGYLALDGEEPVGGGAFVGPPQGGRVEIAYFTRPEHQARGYARKTAAALIAIARQARPDLAIWAKTEPQPGPSPAILERLGFQRDGVAIDHEIGEAWGWLLR
jgi:ribosomal-protein-alanine N-acetyltransferase